MRQFSFLLFLFCICCSQPKNPDLRLVVQTSKTQMGGEYERVVLENRSYFKVYTAKIRQREKRKTGRLYVSDSTRDVVSDKTDTISRFADVVVPPRKWRFLGVRYDERYSMMVDPSQPLDKVRLYKGYESNFTYRILAWSEGGDVDQVKHHSDPFGPGWLSLIDGSVESSQGDIKN